MPPAPDDAPRDLPPGADVPDGVAPVDRRPVLRRLGVLLVGLVAGLVVADRAVAWVDRDVGREARSASPVEPDRVLGWDNVPGFENPEFRTKLDRFGNRNPEIPGDAPLDEVRIAGYGASRTYGAEGALQPRIWNYRLEELLAENGVDARVLNGGVMGYSAAQSVRRAERQFDLLEPDLVFVVVSPRAQVLLDPHGALQWRELSDGRLVPADVVDGWPRALWPAAAGVHERLSQWSGLYRRARARFEVGGRVDPAVQKWLLHRGEQPPAVEAQIDGTLDALEALQHEVEARGAVFRAVVLAESFQDSEFTWERYLDENRDSGAPPLDTPRREPNAALVERLAARGIPAWDLFDAIDEMGDARQRFLLDGAGHWSHRGHARIARELMERIRADGLLESLPALRRERPRAAAYRLPGEDAGVGDAE